MPHTCILLSEPARQQLARENHVDIDHVPVEAEVEFEIRFEGQYFPQTQTDPEALADVCVKVTSVLMDGEFTWNTIIPFVTSAAIDEVYNDYWDYFNSYS